MVGHHGLIGHNAQHHAGEVRCLEVENVIHPRQALEGEIAVGLMCKQGFAILKNAEVTIIIFIIFNMFCMTYHRQIHDLAKQI